MARKKGKGEFIMANEINAFQKFFSYLTENNNTADDFITEADANKDGILTKGEFTNFIKDAIINVTEDEISQLFKSLDTNTNEGKIRDAEGNITKWNNRSALDSKELGKLQDKFEAYAAIKEALDELFGSGYGSVTIPAELKEYVSRASVEESILAKLNKNFECRDLEGAMTAAIAKTAANGVGQAVFNEVLEAAKAAGTVPASYKGDDNFQSLLSAYIKTLDANTDLESIMTNVKDIVTSYFASAGIGEMADSVKNGDLKAFGWKDSQGLNQLQLSVLTEKISAALSVSADTFANFKTEFDSAVQSFIKDALEGGSFAQISSSLGGLDSIAAAFKESKYGKALTVLITYSDFSKPGAGTSELNNQFYNALATALGNDFAETLAMADVDYIAEKGIYNTVLRNVYNMVLKGEIENDNTVIMNKMIELIIENYAQFKEGLGLGSSNSSVEDLYNNVQTLTGNNSALAAIRDAAIAYLDALSALGSEKLNNFIKSEFGGMDYQSAIRNLIAKSVIESKINKINSKYNEMIASGEIVLKIEPSECEADNWTVGTIPVVTAGGDPKTIACQAEVKGPNGQLLESSLTNPITYGIAALGGNTGTTATINADTGEITLTPGAQNGTVIVKVKVMVNGVEIGTKEITVNVKKAMSDVSFASGDKSQHLEVWGTEGMEDFTQLTNYDFSTLYNSNAAICLHMGGLPYSTMEEIRGVHGKTYQDRWNIKDSYGHTTGEIIKDRLTQLGNLVINALTNAGYEKDILEQATKNIVDKWSAKANVKQNAVGIVDHACLSGAEYLKNHTENEGIINCQGYSNYWSCTTDAYMVSFKAFVDAITAEYSRLGGK